MASLICLARPARPNVKLRGSYARDLVSVGLKSYPSPRGPKGSNFLALDQVSLDILEGEFLDC